QREIQEIIEGLVGEFGVGEKVVRLPVERAGHMSTMMNSLRERGLVAGSQRELL
ncbi:MAG: hypothetical protein HYY18_00935, partial [Planctomycetes bacterium]|nr:hypothetical protein [Planctomycetota bacterium]